MHRALFNDNDNKNKIKSNFEDNEVFSISRNLIQRKHEMVGGKSVEINKIFDVKSKFDKDEIDSISLASANIKNNNNTEKFNHFITTNDAAGGGGGRNAFANRIEKLDNHSAQSFFDCFRSFLKCNAKTTSTTTKFASKKINEQLDYPLNLHLRMNEIFTMHDKLSDIAENLNDSYSAGMLIPTSFPLSSS